MPGTGSVFRRKSDGRWVAQVTHGTRANRTIVRRYPPLRDNTRDRAKELLADLLEDVAPLARSTTVGAYLQRWLTDVAARQVRPATLRGYRDVVDLHLTPAIGAIPLRDLTALDVERALRRAADGERHLAPKSVRNVHAVLRRALVYAERDELVARNVARLVEVPRVPVREAAALTAGQAIRLLGALAGDRLEALYRVALLGLRQGEILGLAWKELDLERAELRIRHALARQDHKYVLVQLKTPRSRRTVPLPTSTLLALREHRRRQVEERLAAGVTTEEGLVFVSRSGRPLSGSWLSHDFTRRLELLGLPRVPFHSLRHTAASILAASDVPPRVAMEILGHARVATTMEIYAHVSTAEMRKAMERLDEAIS